MHGYHETLINCGASPQVAGLLCILRAGPRETTCLSVRANFKMIYRPGKTKFFAILRGFSEVLKGAGNAFAHATTFTGCTTCIVGYATWRRWSTRVLCPFHPTRTTLKYVSSSRLWNLVNFPAGFMRTYSMWPNYRYSCRIMNSFGCKLSCVHVTLRFYNHLYPLYFNSYLTQNWVRDCWTENG